ncbi:MAG: hypothetical protein SAL07_15840 [Oscillatoria sp. PMC 1051.18]|nr:hypothetical protein [Oscillatoria sp. PMC 1050.18]MEC5031371.1 hypothetical protein [Oscillatoria sp. PMC 1051.18]
MSINEIIDDRPIQSNLYLVNAGSWQLLAERLPITQRSPFRIKYRRE